LQGHRCLILIIYWGHLINICLQPSESFVHNFSLLALTL
jgi:hypothetical protein